MEDHETRASSGVDVDSDQEPIISDDEMDRVREAMIERADVEAPTPAGDESRADRLHHHLEQGWPALQPHILERWPSLDARALAATSGDYPSLVTLLAAREGLSHAEASRQLDAWLAGL